LQIDSVGMAQGQNGTTGTAQSGESATLFATILSSVLNESARSIGEFSEESSETSSMYGTGLLEQGSSLFGNTQDASGFMENMLALMFAGMLFGGSDAGIALISALLGSGSQENASSSFLSTLGTDTEQEETDINSEGTQSTLQASNLLAYTNQASTVAGAVPANAWETANPLVVNHMGERDPGTYREVISQFGVETSERYRVNKNGVGDTYCNIFSWDVTRAMGAEIPHYVNAATGEPAAQGDAGATELDANATNDWLNTYGRQYGWVEVSAEQAQEYANAGKPAVTSWKNSGGHGHMQVVSPSESGTYDAERGVAIAQAGRHLYNYNYITSVYGQGTLGQVQYFAHI